MDFAKLDSWIPPVYNRVVRRSETSIQSEVFFTSEIKKLVNNYKSLENEPQSQRLARDLIDFCLHRFHNYAIKENIGAHYVEQNITGKKIFEHLIPKARLRDLLISGAMPIKYALYAPTVLLSQENDKKIAVNKLTCINLGLNNPFRRYINAGINSTFMTYKMEELDIYNWSLQKHYEMVGIWPSQDEE